MYKHHYKRFLAANPNTLHFASHSHHYWPDVTREAALEYWDDTARLVDRKWSRVFNEIVPNAQSHIARILDLDLPDNIAFAPNTHEFVVRLLSTFDWSRPLRILTTDGEFHSFTRQINRLSELDTVTVTRIPTMPLDTFEDRFKETIAGQEFEFIFFSQVFFDSGYVNEDLESIVRSVPSEQTVVVIDGYHGFMAVPTSLKSIQERVFYLAGGYKYGQSGEGACFLHIPQGCRLRPINTGWFATFDTLVNERNDTVNYSDNAFRFWGSTFDPSGLYRFNAVMDWMNLNDLSVAAIHDYVGQLQDRFLEKTKQLKSPIFNSETLLVRGPVKNRAHFITYRLQYATKLAGILEEANVIVDSRKDRLRFGFGLYQSKEDIDALIDQLGIL